MTASQVARQLVLKHLAVSGIGVSLSELRSNNLVIGGDVIGCGINTVGGREIFFTKNGRQIGKRDSKYQLERNQ